MSAKNLYLLFSLLIFNLSPKSLIVGSELGLIFHGGYTFSSFKNHSHYPVMLEQIIEICSPKKGGNLTQGT